jgi:L-alanine-DL-glutamate epimerase-like enolase superfamily enzyme
MDRIADLSVTAVDHPLENPFEIALGRQTTASNVVATVRTESGTVGYGEGSPLPPVTGETQETVVAVVRAMRELVEGHQLADRRGLSRSLANAFGSAPAARLAVETAVVDARCRQLEVPLAGLIGGPARPVETDMTVPIVEPDQAQERAAAAAAAGYDHLKVKAGTDLAADLDRLLAVRAGAADAALKLDANQGWTVSETVQFVDRLRDHGLSLELLEQPVDRDDISGLARVTEQVAPPVAADEALLTPADAIELVRADAADVLNVKLGKSGLVGAQSIVEIAQAANRELMIGCMLESAVGIHAAAHVAAGTDAFSYVDLDGNRLLAADVIEDTGPTIDITGPGHGVEPF